MTFLFSDGKGVSCYMLNQYIRAWIVQEPTGVSLTLGHLNLKNLETAMEEMRENGLKFNVNETDHLQQAATRTGIIEQMLAFAVDHAIIDKKSSFTTVPHPLVVNFGQEVMEGDKTVRVSYHHMYGRKVEFGDDKQFIRMPLGIFNKMMHLLRKEVAPPRDVVG